MFFVIYIIFMFYISYIFCYIYICFISTFFLNLTTEHSIDAKPLGSKQNESLGYCGLENWTKRESRTWLYPVEPYRLQVG